MEYDFLLNHDHIDYGFVRGGDKLVFVKTGLGGNCMGYENKYLIMARQLREKYGCGVIVASNPKDDRSHVRIDRQIAEQYAADQGISSPEWFFFGHSNGCLKGLELANEGVAFRKMLLVNMPLMINFHKTKRYISAIAPTEIMAVFGDGDPSYSYRPFLARWGEHIRVTEYPGADHNFKGMTREFISLSEWLME